MSADLGTIYYQIDAKADEFLTQSKTVDRQIAKTETGLADVEKQMDKTNAASKELGGGLNAIAAALKAVAAAAALREIAAMVQGYEEMADRVRMATSSTGEFEAVQARLVQTANGTYRSLSEAQELYIRTADSLRSMGYTTAQAMDVTDSLSYAFVTNATSVDKAAGAIDAMAKVLAKGKVEADAWETIVAATPSVIQAVADASGKTAAQVRALGAAGKLAAADLTEGLRKSLEGNTKAAGEMSNNLRDAGVRIETALTAVFVAVENQTGAWATLTAGIIKAADWILEAAGDSDKMATMIDVATTAVTAMAAIMAGRLLTALGSYLVSQTALIAGLVRQNLAERAAATSALALAQAQLAVATNYSYRKVATEAVAVAQARLNAVTTAGAVAARGLGVAMGLLGGPAGLILLAAAAVFTFSQRTAEAKKPIDGMTESVIKLGTAALQLQKIQLMDKIQQMGQLGETASNSAARIETLQKNLKEFPNSAKAEDWKRELVEQRAAAEAAGGELQKYQQRVKDVEKELANRALGLPSEDPNKPPELVTPPDPSAAEAAAKKRKTLLEANVKALKELSESEKEAALSGYDLAESQNLAKMNNLATPEQIAKVKELTRAIFDKNELVKAAAEEEKNAAALQKAATAADPRTAAADKYKTDLEQYQAFKANQLITDQQYEELKAAAATQYEAQRLAAQEQMFAAQSRANAFVMDSLNALGASGTQVISSLLAGTMNTTEALQALGNTIFNQVIGAVVEWGLAQVKAMIMGQTAQAAATTAGIAQGVALEAAYTPAAIAASIASFGGAAVAGASAMAASVPAMAAMITAGRKSGGPTTAGNVYRVNEGGKPEIWTGSNGSQYMTAPTNGHMTSNADAMGGQGGINITVNNNVANAQVRTETGENEQGRFVSFFIDDMNSGGPMYQSLSSQTNVQRVGT